MKDSDDSYEAAMRAADALFAPPRDGNASNGNRGTGDRSTVVHGPRVQGALPNAASGSIATAPQPTVSPPPAGPEKNGGRILRAIDEAPSPEYAALEAERAPKRRGRKPGSKNRPKVPAISVEVAPQTSGTDETVAPAATAAVQMTTRQVPTRVAAIMGSPNAAARNAKRFPWVRDRLGPGEDWKRRRLPRVCW